MAFRSLLASATRRLQVKGRTAAGRGRGRGRGGEGEAARLRSGTRGTLDQALQSVSLFTFTDKRGCRDLSIGDSPMDSKETNWEGRWQTKETQVKEKNIIPLGLEKHAKSLSLSLSFSLKVGLRRRHSGPKSGAEERSSRRACACTWVRSSV